MSRRPPKVTQADIARAIRAVEQSRCQWVIEITPDGTIRILPAALANVAVRVSEEEGDDVIELL
jgi:hypothetical protein